MVIVLPVLDIQEHASIVDLIIMTMITLVFIKKVLFKYCQIGGIDHTITV